MVRICLFFIFTWYVNAFGQYLTSFDIDTCNKSEAEICEDIQSKYDSLYNIYLLSSSSTITKGFVFPTFYKSKKERRKGYFIYLDTTGFLPDSISCSDVYVTFIVDPYGRIICFNLRNLPEYLKLGDKRYLLEKELKNYIESKLLTPGYWGENDNRAIYFPQINPKIKIQSIPSHLNKNH